MNTKIAAVEDAINVKEVNSIDLISLIFIFSPQILLKFFYFCGIQTPNV